MEDTTREESELSLRELISKLKSTLSYLNSKRNSIIICSFLIGLLSGVYAYMSPVTYQGTVTFILDEDAKSPLGGAYSGIASQLGLNLGGGSSSGIFSGNNVMLLLKSRRIVQKALLSPVTVNGKSRLLVNYYIDVNHLHTKWAKKPALKDYYFPDNFSEKTSTRLTDSLLAVFYIDLSEKRLLIEKQDKSAGLIAVEFGYTNELFAKLFLDNLIAGALKFYIEGKTQKALAVVNLLQQKTDSVRRELEIKLGNAARYKDENLGIIKAEGKVREIRQDKEVEMLFSIYTEMVKNLELSKANLVKETPIIQVIDKPQLPLLKEKKSKLKFAMAGFFVGLILLVGFFLAKQQLSKALAA